MLCDHEVDLHRPPFLPRHIPLFVLCDSQQREEVVAKQECDTCSTLADSWNRIPEVGRRMMLNNKECVNGDG